MTRSMPADMFLITSADTPADATIPSFDSQPVPAETKPQNEDPAAEIERRRERIERLSHNSTEQEMEIRKQLKLLRPGETTFLLPDAPKDAPKNSQAEPDAK